MLDCGGTLTDLTSMWLGGVTFLGRGLPEDTEIASGWYLTICSSPSESSNWSLAFILTYGVFILRSPIESSRSIYPFKWNGEPSYPLGDLSAALKLRFWSQPQSSPPIMVMSEPVSMTPRVGTSATTNLMYWDLLPVSFTQTILTPPESSKSEYKKSNRLSVWSEMLDWSGVSDRAPLLHLVDEVVLRGGFPLASSLDSSSPGDLGSNSQNTDVPLGLFSLHMPWYEQATQQHY